MSTIYYPSCKLKAGFPKTAQVATAYMDGRGAVIGACCRGEATKASVGDTAVFNCNTCAIFLDEWANADVLKSIYEVLDADGSFDFPDYGGKTFAVQDCWRANDRPNIRKAIRSLAHKMNVEVIEVEGNGDGCMFCGGSTMMPMPPHYPQYAPRRFGERLPDWIFKELLEDERRERMKAHCVAIPVDDVICNCTGCTSGIAVGGKNPVHILELVFGTEK